MSDGETWEELWIKRGDRIAELERQLAEANATLARAATDHAATDHAAMLKAEHTLKAEQTKTNYDSLRLEWMKVCREVEQTEALLKVQTLTAKRLAEKLEQTEAALRELEAGL